MAKARSLRQVSPSALPPIPAEHIRLTHNSNNPRLISGLQYGDGFRFRHNIGATTDAFSTNDSVADWISSGARDSFGPLTLLMDLPYEEHNKRLGRGGWQGYEPVPNQSVVGHIDESGLFVPLQRVQAPPQWEPSKVIDEWPIQPYRIPEGYTRPIGGAVPSPVRVQQQTGSEPRVLYNLLDPNDIW